MLRVKQIIPFYNTAKAWIAAGSYKDSLAFLNSLGAKSSDSDDKNNEKQLSEPETRKETKVIDECSDGQHRFLTETKKLLHPETMSKVYSSHARFIEGLADMPVVSTLTKIKSKVAFSADSCKTDAVTDVGETYSSVMEHLRRLGFAYAGRLLYFGDGAYFMVQRTGHTSFSKQKPQKEPVGKPCISSVSGPGKDASENYGCLPRTQTHENRSQNMPSHLGLLDSGMNTSMQTLAPHNQGSTQIFNRGKRSDFYNRKQVALVTSLPLSDNIVNNDWQVYSGKPNAKVRQNAHQAIRNSDKTHQTKNAGQPHVHHSGRQEPVDSVCNILSLPNWTPRTESLLSEWSRKLSPYHVNEILKRQQNPSVASHFFGWTKRQKCFKHDVHTYTTMVGILGRARNFDAVSALMEEMKKEGCKPSVVTYNRLIHCYGRANRMADALNFFYEMKELGCVPDKVTYCTLIDLHAKAGSLDVAMDMYRKMRQAGLQPDTFTYSVIINCLGKAGELPAAQKVLNEMIDKGCTPNLVTYNILIDLHAKSGKHETALKLYNDMLEMGYHPDQVTYSIIMEVLRHSGHLVQVEHVFSQMEAAGWAPDATVYGLLVDMWGKAGNSMKACAWYNKMINSGIKPNVPTCNSLLGAFLREGSYDAGKQLLEEMRNQGLAPSLQTYTLLLSCYTMSERTEDALKIWNIMNGISHPAHAFMCVLHEKVDVRKHASLFFEAISGENQESKRSFTDAAISYLHKAKMKEEAARVWEIAAERKVYPSAVTKKSANHWAINLHYMSMGTAMVALSRTLWSLKQGMLETGEEPERIDIITGWGRRSRVAGSSRIKQAVEETLDALSSPFQVENGNLGCFVGIGRALVDWLYQSDMDRLHLLV